jgi:hypothetical protein
MRCSNLNGRIGAACPSNRLDDIHGMSAMSIEILDMPDLTELPELVELPEDVAARQRSHIVNDVEGATSGYSSLRLKVIARADTDIAFPRFSMRRIGEAD